ncbi:hypothetical protein [Gayadomonas joobiniege]|uniref:hypothetical protein n=1 Tax=Gayadomonas joobiniege TaxID=1234606 RepID=UPI00036E516C|nr:hypothetical protein [Gayadomonas joobiniege]
MDPHGISFPCDTGCQMRFIRNKVDLGGFYSYRQWGGVEKAIKAAIHRNEQLKALYPTSMIKRVHKPKDDTSCGFNGVGFREKLDKRRQEVERFYWVSYRKNGKPAVKTFSLGYADYSAELQLHAYLTAIQFRAEWDLFGTDMYEDKYKDWKKCRLYRNGYPSVSFNRARRRRRKKLDVKQSDSA